MPKLDQIRILLQTNPKDNFLRFALAKEYEKMQKDTEAEKIYQSIVADSPDYIGTYYHLGKTLERLERDAEAFKVYTLGMERAKNLGETHARNELAGARLELGDEEDFLD
ncbi:MAG: hypothetical protein AAF828_07165 [Bacteroidota bacterium]